MKKTKRFSNISILSGLVLLLWAMAGPPGPAVALDHSGSVSENETWAVVDNPHVITGNVTVDNLVTLTLEPGVEVLFSGNYWIAAYGAILAEGTESDPIRFTRGPGVPFWYGLYLYEGSGGIFTHCLIEWANYYGISADSCYLEVSDCTIRNNTTGLYAVTINPYLADNVFENNTTGLRIDSYYAPSAADEEMPTAGQNNIFRDNDTGIYFYDCIMSMVGGTAQITRNKLYGVLFSDCASPRVLADIFESGTGIYYLNCQDIYPLEGISLIGNTGAHGAVLVCNSGPVQFGTGNTIADNTCPISIDIASYATETSIIPLTGNHTQGIQVFYGTGGQQDVTWYDLDLPYMVVNNLSVGASGSLTIEPGVEVRFGANLSLSIIGDFQSNGSTENGILMTRDQAARWDHLGFSAGSTGSLSYTTIEFSDEGIYANTAAPEIGYCMLMDNRIGYYGYANATSYIHDCLITDNSYGVSVRTGSDPVISQNSIKQNFNYGVRQEDTSITIDAEDNFWGDPSGPRHASNPAGRGVFVSDYVDFDPWLSSDPL